MEEDLEIYPNSWINHVVDLLDDFEKENPSGNIYDFRSWLLKHKIESDLAND